MTSHRDCTHPATKAARARCRKNRAPAEPDRAQEKAEALADAARDDAARELIRVFDDRLGADRDYISRAAIAFTPFEYGGERIDAALALLDYFGPSGDEDSDRRRRANGYTITTSPSEILRIVLRRFS